MNKAFLAVVCAMALLVQKAPARADAGVPPRTIADIAAILDGEKPDLERLASQQSTANAAAPDTTDKTVLARFYIDRAENRGRLGRVREATADIEKAEKLVEGNKALQTRTLSLAGQLYGWAGDTRRSLQAFLAAERAASSDRRYNIERWIGIDLIALGDLDQAEKFIQRNRDALAEAEKNPGWSTDPFRNTAEAHVAFGDAAILEARGRFGEAADAYERAEQRFRDSLVKLSQLPNPPIRSSVEQVIYWMPARAGRVRAREGRLVEAEIDVRRSLIGWLKLSSKYDLNTARIVDVFTSILVEQGRFAEAETMARTVIDIYRTIGAESDSQVMAIGLNRLAGILALQGNWKEAAKSYAELDAATSAWEQSRKEEIGLDLTRVLTACHTANSKPAVEMAEHLIARHRIRFGDQHVETALAHGVLGMALLQAGRRADALVEFRFAAPALAAAESDQTGEDDAVGAATREQRIREVIESYMTVLASTGGASINEAFRMAEVIRGRTVQKALTASAARAVAGSTQLAELVRKQQDLEKQIGATLDALNGALAVPPHERDEHAIQDFRAQVATLRASLQHGRDQLREDFPEYADLIAPVPPTVAAVQSKLTPGEAALSFYFGDEHSFVWAIPQTGPVSFSLIPLSLSELATEVHKLREALEPEVAMISDIPPFDLKLGYKLYSQLLKPVEAGWKPARNLIVVTNGALGLLPLSLLPTAPDELDPNEAILFSSYRKVRWLSRTHAVTIVPSSAAFLTLRSLPPGKSGRGELIAFGDPYFAPEQAAEAVTADQPVQIVEASSTMRGVPLRRRSSPKLDKVDTAQLAMLPRLPDTADELRSIANALHADPSQSLKLGKAANEQAVKTIDLSNSKVIAFATHGLVPGELDGLTQPALALSAPAVAGVDGDGLLTMSEILTLKLDADWVVLSACNTGAGAGTGAEAASGLGRAFFYAGTRALLVTNWSVHSKSAKDLVTDLFRRQSNDPKLTRSEALRQAMMALVDGPGFIDANGETEFAYAHPLFWAPYSIIGDGGRS